MPVELGTIVAANNNASIKMPTYNKSLQLTPKVQCERGA
jgi:hypothetical protein